MWTQISLIWNLIRPVSSKPHGALFPAERSPAPRLPAARCFPPRRLSSSRRVLGSGRNSSLEQPRPAPSYLRLSLCRWAACPLPQPRRHTRLSVLPASGCAGGRVEKALRSPRPCPPSPPGAVSTGPTSGGPGPGATSFLPRHHLGNPVTLSICGNNPALPCKWGL